MKGRSLSAGFGWTMFVLAIGMGLLLWLSGDHDMMSALGCGLWLGMYVERSKFQIR